MSRKSVGLALVLAGGLVAWTPPAALAQAVDPPSPGDSVAIVPRSDPHSLATGNEITSNPSPGPVAPAYATDTHQRLSILAVQHSQSLVDVFLRNELLLLPNGVRTESTAVGYDGEFSLIDWVGQGAIHEDEGSDIPPRPFHHFYNPLNNHGLSDNVPTTYRNALLWAWNAPANQYNWTEARLAFEKALTNPFEDYRMRRLAQTFFDLGHIAHLLEDMAQPQHTRNDAHGPLESQAPYEIYVRDYFWSPLPEKPLPAFDSSVLMRLRNVHPNGANIPPNFEALWDTDQYRAETRDAFYPPGFIGDPGLAEYSNFNFLTDGTLFDQDAYRNITCPQSIIFRDIVAEVHHRFRYPSLRLTSLCAQLNQFPNWSIAFLDRDGESLDTTRSGRTLLPVSTGFIDNAFTLAVDIIIAGELRGAIGFREENYAALANDLLPKAVSYAAALLNYFFRARLQTEMKFKPQTRRFELTVTNTTPDEGLGAGHWQLLVDDPHAGSSGHRRTVVDNPDSGELTSTYASTHASTLPTGEDFTSPVPTAQGCGDQWTVVFVGTVGDEKDIAVAAKRFSYDRVPGTWLGSYQVPFYYCSGPHSCDGCYGIQGPVRLTFAADGDPHLYSGTIDYIDSASFAASMDDQCSVWFAWGVGTLTGDTMVGSLIWYCPCCPDGETYSGPFSARKED